MDAFMVNVFMKKHQWLVWPVLIAAVAPLLVILRTGDKGNRDETESAGQARDRQTTDRDRSMRMAESKGWLDMRVDPSWHALPDEKCQEIRIVFDEMAEAYEKGLTNQIRELAARMPGCVSNASDLVYMELCGSFYGLVRDRFLFLKEPLEFNNVADFKTYLDGSLLATEVLGDIDLLRRDYSMIARLDTQVVRQLRRYKAKLDGEQRAEMSRFADRCLESWCERIDSPGGYTHRHMIFQISLQLAGKTNWRWEDLLGAVRHDADALVAAGYKPRWLDDEFPQSVEWERKHAADPLWLKGLNGKR